MSTRVRDIIVIALDQADYDLWLEQNDELSTADVQATFPRTWEDLAPSKTGYFATTYVFTERASMLSTLAATEAPRWVRIAEVVAERRRPAYLKVAA